MVDYSLDDTFDIHFTDQDDFATVDGREEFEQDVLVDLNSNLRALIGSGSGSSTLKQKARLIVTRTARETGLIDSINKLVIEKAASGTETLSIEIIYVTGETFEETI